VVDVSDAELVLRVRKQRDDAAFAALYRRFRQVVHGVLLARVDRATADDLMQEVFVTAANKIDTLDKPESIGAWLCSIARNKALDHLRSRKQHDEVRDDDVEVAPTADAVIDMKRALAAIRALPEAYRETLILRLVEGLSGPEIAAQTGLTEGSVRVNLHRGMQLLREALSS
jgi:RNA polymerase sigma-70 factor, ECF subfamily